MSLPTLRVGITDPERDAEIADALLTLSVNEVADRECMTEKAVRDASRRVRQRRDFDLYIENGSQGTRVCHVITSKSFVDVARAYRNSLNRLHTPGWELTDGTHRVSVEDLQRAHAPKSVNPKERERARKVLGMTP